ncbi:keratin, type I cytoskeletal 19-like [Bufo bufo]|uniref:keratin, type I cytoskeletal 19-like n=1 Tax=Bufo bufo TaxID=8384 RepID=UPI001ABDA4D7|nr:keratin, type I cytoskeletal 19-like [Bufo bufo]
MYNQVSFKKVTSVKTGSISDGAYHRVSGGSYASSVYAGAGGLGTQISKNVTGRYVQYGSIQIMGNQKKTMQNLNDRLASYINQVRSLEKANAKLDGHIREWYSKNSGSSERDYKHYFETIEGLRKQILDATTENASILLQIDNARLAGDDFKTKFENEQVIRLSGEKDLFELRKVVDQLTITKAELEMQIEGLKEELIFLTKNHKEEIDELLKKRTGAVNVEVDVAPPVDLGKIMEEMRAQYEQLVEKQRFEAKNVFEKKVEQWNMEIQINTSDLEKFKQELKEYRQKVQELEMESEAELNKKNIAVAMLENIDAQNSMQLTEVQENINNIETLLQKTRRDVGHQVSEFTLLLSLKNRLEAEIATYRSLLDGATSSITK